MDRDLGLKAIIGLSLVGLLVAGYQTYEHYYLTSAVCDLSATFSCSVVTESRFGEFPPSSGVATAFWGMLWWIGLIAFSYLTLKGRRIIEEQDFYLLGYVTAGTGFIAYLLAVELYILPQETGVLVICPFCTVQHILILLVLFIAWENLEKPVAAALRSVLNPEGPDLFGIDPQPVFIAAWGLLLLVGMFPILGAADVGRNYHDFAACLADSNATMYGFDACPHCNKQKSLLGREAFKEQIEDRGFYVECQPRSEATEALGDRASRISTVEPLPPSTTQGEACSINLGAGTPTWVIDGEKYVGEQSLIDLANATGCELPEDYRGAGRVGGYSTG